ncbi:hypothetical protein INR49_009740 [Caranx melampygus]|nr:hypothetical protein INR49_009740 [Caranx melampygus]
MSKKKKDWKAEKERLLRLEREERRKEYRRQDFISLDKIPTWREENRANDNEEGQELTAGGGLSDKVSLYKGDITVLEVDAIVNADVSFVVFAAVNDGIPMTTESEPYDFISTTKSLSNVKRWRGSWPGTGIPSRVRLYHPPYDGHKVQFLENSDPFLWTYQHTSANMIIAKRATAPPIIAAKGRREYLVDVRMIDRRAYSRTQSI